MDLPVGGFLFVPVLLLSPYRNLPLAGLHDIWQLFFTSHEFGSVWWICCRVFALGVTRVFLFAFVRLIILMGLFVDIDKVWSSSGR